MSRKDNIISHLERLLERDGKAGYTFRKQELGIAEYVYNHFDNIKHYVEKGYMYEGKYPLYIERLKVNAVDIYLGKV